MPTDRLSLSPPTPLRYARDRRLPPSFLKAGVAAADSCLALAYRVPRRCRSGDVRHFEPNAFIRIGSDGSVTLTMPQVEMVRVPTRPCPCLSRKSWRWP